MLLYIQEQLSSLLFSIKRYSHIFIESFLQKKMKNNNTVYL
jgi:hypothetical protein